MAPILMQELEEVVFQIKYGTALGPDGFTINFFHQFWDILKNDILNIVEDSCQTQGILKAFNATFLTLIPKKKGADEPNHFIPISLCNVIYKIITKIIANRLKLLLPKIISLEQAGFVEGRQIMDGVILIHEMAYSLRTTKKLGMFLKIDMAKAYDKLSWQYLSNTLKAFGFQDRWVNWISNLISKAFFSVLLNGSPTKCFSPTRGIRQGDPLSPIMFIIAAEGLGRMLKAQQERGVLKGLDPHLSGTPHTHQQFVDDTMLMGHSSIQEAKEIQRCLKLFSNASGLEVNPSKSSIFFFNTPIPLKDRITRILGFHKENLLSKYLRIPLLDKILKRTSWQELLDKLQNKLLDWTARALNLLGCLTLLKSVMQSMSLYLLTALNAPKEILKEIRKNQRKYM